MTAVPSPSEKPDWLTGLSTLKGPVLMLILERPGHAWDVGVRLGQRLGPTWSFDPNDIYSLLKRLTRLGLLEARLPDVREGPSRGARHNAVYHPTALTERAVAEWIEMPISREPDRSAMLALLAVMPEERAPELLLRLDEYARECALASRKVSEEYPTESWIGLLMELARKAVIARLEAEINWSETAREWIKERLAAKS
jgi:DNA-binding PadR family transcriptional regulator